MKKRTKTLLTVAACSVSVVAGACLFCNSVKKSHISLPDSFTVTAHTGCEGTADNSLESIRKAYECSADIVEFDLNFNGEGNPVLSHDEPEEICVSLDEAFSVIAEYDKLKVNVDVKNTKNLKSVVECAEKHGITQRIFYTGIRQENVPEVKKQTPEMTYYLNMDVDKFKKRDKLYLNALADTVEAEGAVGINLNYRGCSKQLVEVFHERGLLVSVWTVNSKPKMRKMLSMSVDNMTSRHPSRVNEIVKETK